MKSKNILCGLSMAVVLHLGVLAGSAQNSIYLYYSGSETNITLPPGTYIIAAFGALGGSGPSFGGDGDWLSAEFNFSMSTPLTLLVGGAGGDGYSGGGGGGGGGSLVVEGRTPLVIAGGGGGGGYGNPNYTGYGGTDGPNGCAGGFSGDAGGDGTGGTGGGGGGGGSGLGIQYSAGGGGGGFLGDGTDGTGYASLPGGSSGGGSGGGSFERGGEPIPNGHYSNGGFGGGGGGGTGYNGGGGGGGGYSGGGGAGDENANPYVGGGGGGGSTIDSSAIAISYETGPYLTDVRGNGEIIITAVAPPLTNADGSIYTYNTNADGSANIVSYVGPPWVVTIPAHINGLTVTTIGTYAFYGCTSLASVTIPGSVTSIGQAAFAYCYGLASVYFTSNAPSPTNDSTVFAGDYYNATVYYLPGTTGWGAMFDGLPTAPWFLPNPQILNNGPGFGVQPGGFGFTISWATNASVVVEAATNLANPVWLPVSTNTLTGGTSYFSDPQSTNNVLRFYRVRSP